MTHCPTPEKLRGLLADGPSDPEGEAIEAHVETCAGRQQALEGLTGSAYRLRARGPAPQSSSGADFLRRLEAGPGSGRPFRARAQPASGAAESDHVSKPLWPGERTRPFHGADDSATAESGRIPMTLVPASGPQP